MISEVKKSLERFMEKSYKGQIKQNLGFKKVTRKKRQQNLCQVEWIWWFIAGLITKIYYKDSSHGGNKKV